MKTLLILAGMFLSNYCPAQSDDWKPKARPSISEQLTQLLTLPEGVSMRVRCIVLVQFQISEDCRICRVRVHADDRAIKEHLIRQLTDRKLQMPSSDFAEVHTARVHFQ